MKPLILFVLLCFALPTLQAQSQGLCDDTAFEAEDMTASKHTHQDKRILLLSGGFGEYAARNVNRDIGRTHEYDEVWMCSPGGLVSQGMEVGRALSRAQATVRVPRGFRCVSACTIAFMGGFVRIIEPESRYIVHASSAFLSIKPDKVTGLDCSEPGAAGVCNWMLDLYDAPVFRCGSVEELEDPNADCIIYDPAPNASKKPLILYRQRAQIEAPASPDLLRFYSDRLTESQITSTIELLYYYQEMLLSGQTQHIRSNAYSSLRAQFRPLRLYDPANFGQDARFAADDVRALDGAGLYDRIGVWQSIFTDTELNVKRQLIDYIQKSGLSFGPAGGDAVKILEAMVICQIQTECRLQPSEAAALGIHNVFDAE